MDRAKQFENNDLPTIAALLKGENSWRIDWFGDLAFPNRSIRRTQPSLLLHLSRVLAADFRTDPAVLLSPGSTSPAKFQRKVWVSAGTLPLLRIGDIWRDGKLEATPDYQCETFEDLLIDGITVKLIKAGLNLSDRGFVLPLSEHPWHMLCTQSYCVMVELPDDRRLIIPCVELIRFYFGSSSGLVTKLFMPPLERRTLYRNPQFTKTNGRLVLELGDRISGASASDIGRLHLDPIAWRAALHVGTSALKASLTSEHVYPQAFFPFEGVTTITAAGKWLSLGDQVNATFLVYSLRSCSHPFPFQSLQYKVSGKRNGMNNAGNDGNGNTGTTNVRRTASDSANQEIVERDAARSLSSKTQNVRAEPRFPDLKKKSIWKNKVLVPANANEKIVGSGSAAIERAAIGESGSSQRIRSVDLAIAMRRRWPVPVFLQTAVNDLTKVEGLEVELLTESEDDGWTLPIDALTNDDGEIDPTLFVDAGDGMLRLRRVSVLAVKGRHEQISIVLIESRPLHIHAYTTTGESADEVYETLTCAVGDYLFRPAQEKLSVRALIEWIFATST